MKIVKSAILLLTLAVAGQALAGVTEYQTSTTPSIFSAASKNMSAWVEGAMIAGMGGVIAQTFSFSNDKRIGTLATGLIALMLYKRYMDHKKCSVYFISQKDFESKKPEAQAKVQVALHSGVSCLILDENKEVIKVINNGKDITHLHSKTTA